MRCKDETHVTKPSSIFLNQSLEILMSSKKHFFHFTWLPSGTEEITAEQYYKMLTINLIPAEESARHRNNSAV